MTDLTREGLAEGMGMAARIAEDHGDIGMYHSTEFRSGYEEAGIHIAAVIRTAAAKIRKEPAALAAWPEVQELLREAELRGRLAGFDQASDIAGVFYKKALERADAAHGLDDELEVTASAYGSVEYAIRAAAATIRKGEKP